MPSLSNAVRTSSFNLHVTFALIIHLENAASTPLSPATPKPTCHFFPCTFPSHRFHLTWVGPVHKLWGSPSSVALGAFVVSCQLNLPLQALVVFFCSPQCPRSATSFALGHWASLSLAIDSISPIWRWSFPSSTMGCLCLFLVRRQVLPTLMSMMFNFAIYEVI